MSVIHCLRAIFIETSVLSHNDPGWINTFEEYYERQTKNIFANMLRHLDEHENMKFIWAEIVYFSRWYDSLTSKISKDTVKKYKPALFT